MKKIENYRDDNGVVSLYKINKVNYVGYWIAWTIGNDSRVAQIESYFEAKSIFNSFKELMEIVIEKETEKANEIETMLNDMYKEGAI